MSDQDIELAAALAAVDAFLRAQAEQQAGEAAPPDREAWRRNARLAACGITAPQHNHAGWSTAERLRRGAGGLYGVIGL